ncbi:TniQ family protein [Deinococcus pimensis]|uniref:TniQ family protein n=1 Tax=Deinococcus pimensis TaxID=309888 RepID=UPI00146F9A33|nr:TniQ family protein [Deinococcus pimensis]
MTVKPLHDELLSSWTCRLAIANIVQPARLTRALGAPSFWRGDPDRDASDEDLFRLARAAEMDLAELGALRLSALLSLLGGDAATQGPVPLLVPPRAQYWRAGSAGHPACPACLREQGVFRRTWRLVTTVACDTHHVTLVENCGRCGAPVCVTRAHASRTFPRPWRPEACWRCGDSLPAAPDPPVETLASALAVQWLVAEAATTGRVNLQGLTLSGAELAGIVRTLLHQLLGPVGHLRILDDERAALGLPSASRLRSVSTRSARRLEAVALAGRLLRGGLPGLLETFGALGLTAMDLLPPGAPAPSWFADLGYDQLGRQPRVRRLTFLPSDFEGLTDAQWARADPLLPPAPIKRGGQQRLSRRRVLDTFLARPVLGSGRGTWLATCHPHLHRWAEGGHLDQALDALLAGLREDAGLNLDDTGVLATQVASAPTWATSTLGALLAPDLLADLKRWDSALHTPLWTLAGRLALETRQLHLPSSG